MRIENARVLITGASSGIGEAVARIVAKRGGRPILLARRRPELERVAAAIGAGRDPRIYPVDLSDSAAVDAVGKAITRDVGTPDVIVNNAGAGRWRFIEETSPEEAVQMMSVPYFAAFFVTRAFLPAMFQRNSGHVVNVSSVGSRFVWPGATAYLAARWAVRGFTEALRADLRGTGIGTTLFECGVVESSYWNANPGSRERVPKIARFVPNVTPEQAARAIVGAIERGRRHVVIPFMMRVVYLQHALAPGVVQWLMTTTGYHPDRRPSHA